MSDLTPAYHKIDSVYKRDPGTNYRTFLEQEWSRPEFGLLADCQWVATEKVDGTNVRVHVYEDSFKIGGRTEKADISPSLTAKLTEIGERAMGAGLHGLTLYGEGFGGRIQKVGPLYGEEQVVLFDVMTTERHTFLQRSDVKDIAAKVGVQVVPQWDDYGSHTLASLIEWMKFFVPGAPVLRSRLGDCEVEGVVATPLGDFRDRLGRRIITKVKRRDWPTDTTDGHPEVLLGNENRLLAAWGDTTDE